MREQELRNFRSFTTEYEERNAISAKHIENMREITERLESEVEKDGHSNERLHQILDCLKENIVDHIGNEIPDGLPVELVDNLINTTDDDNSGAAITTTIQPVQEYEYGPVTQDNLDKFIDTLNSIASLDEIVI
ncbi:high mobility group protein 20a-like isoform x2 [Dermatophagoides farinae]|uniref:High mobility group protein 20a-like isoform x2 n=1 Tax=Dermatophagoides farinae TaxID=6954 RepID=A0A9D4P4A4_DERFA|nr:high mobility group protein 20a-like isoform x2 [Dermatophagoides farinae]